MKYRPLTITPGISGFKVRVGCSEIYFSNWEDLVDNLKAYFKSPEETEKRFMEYDLRMGPMEGVALPLGNLGGLGALTPGQVFYTDPASVPAGAGSAPVPRR